MTITRKHSAFRFQVSSLLAAACVALTLTYAIAATAAEDIVGKVIAVYDGDTVTVLDDSRKQHKIRLAEIDTPERHQDFGTRAKQALSEKIFGKIVRVKVVTTDRYGRTVGHIYLADRLVPRSSDAGTAVESEVAWINAEMVAEGMAWHYKKYSKDESLAQAEQTARIKKLGLWSHPNPTPPWDFRRPKKPSPPTEVKITEPQAAVEKAFWLNESSNVRHNRSCKYFQNTKRGRLCGPNDGKAGGCCGG